jgi:hypothetical protein
VSALHHVSLEVRPDESERLAELFELAGFERVEAPQALGPHVVWLERDGSQIHLIRSEEPTVMQLGHPALVAPDEGFDATVEALREAGFEVEDHEPLWGAKRSFAIGPGGLRVEIMEFPPPAAR